MQDDCFDEKFLLKFYVNLCIRFFKIFALLIVAGSFCSCMLSSKMDKIVSEYYAKKGSLKPVEDKGHVVFNSAPLQRVPGFCRSRYKNYFTIPLLFYTYASEKINCQVNPKIYAGAIASYFYSELNADSTWMMLKDKTLEVTFNELPCTFTHRYQDHYLILQYGFNMSFSNEEMMDQAGKIRISYVIRDQAGNATQGQIEQPVSSTYNKRNFAQSRKTMVKNFIYIFDDKYLDACAQIARELKSELRKHL
jgi:hypothetical protein